MLWIEKQINTSGYLWIFFFKWFKDMNNFFKNNKVKKIPLNGLQKVTYEQFDFS